MKSTRWLFVLCLSFFVLGCSSAGTYTLSLRYQPVKELSSLQTKVGPTLGLTPIKDERPNPYYIGFHTDLQGDAIYFKSHPFPLDWAIQECLSDVLSRYEVKTIPVSHWDGRPDSLKPMESDSVLMIEIKKFWTDGKSSLFQTTVKAAVQLVIHLGVKKEAKVFTRNVEVEKEIAIARFTPERVETMINQILAEIFDSFFSNPYESLSL